MPGSSNSALALTGWLRELTDAELIALLRVRDVRDAGIKDFFDLADRLLDPASIQAALTQLDRRVLLTLTVICDLGSDGPASPEDVAARILEIDHPDTAKLPSTVATRSEILAARALIAITPEGFTAYDQVRDQLRAWPSMRLPGVQAFAAELPKKLLPDDRPSQQTTDTFAAERAFTTCMAVAEVLTELRREPVRELARGGIGGPDSKRIVAASGIDAGQLTSIRALAARAGLLRLNNGVWSTTPDLDEWLVAPAASRWARLAAAWNAALPDDVRMLLADRGEAVWGNHLDEFVTWLYPAATPLMKQRIETQVTGGELLGVFAGDAQSTPGSLLLTEGADAAEAAMAALLPAEVDAVYLQHDLSVVSPGPLAPRLDARLRTVADVEARAIATSYRISPESITRGLASGETADSIRSFLGELSLTGIPQPLEYLLTETSERYGLVRVGSTGGPDAAARTYVSSVDPHLLATILVDRRLTPLGIRAVDEYRAVSRFERDVLYWSLFDAKYPVVAENSRGEAVEVDRVAPARSVSARTAVPVVDQVAALAERLRISAAGSSEQTGIAWLERRLELAIKGKAPVTVTVSMQDGSETEYLLEPSSVSGGRLRGLDRRADTERTLPLSRIVAIDGVA